MKSKQASNPARKNKSAASATAPPQSDFIKDFRSKKVTTNFGSTRKEATIQNSPKSDSKIVHPFAKYNAAGQLQCVLCSLVLPSGKAWPIHILTRKHKDNMEILRKKANKSSKPCLKEPTVSESSPSRETEATAPPAKRLKSILKNTHTSAGEDELTEPKLDPIQDKPLSSPAPVNDSDTPQGSLPSDFFEGSSSKSRPVLPQSSPPREDIEQKEGGEKGSEVLPEGFFDDPKVDAKKRGVKPLDAMEKEWESFQRVLETENEQSEQIVAQQDQEVQLERDFSESHLQNVYYSRAEELRVLQEGLSVPLSDTREQGDTREAGEGGREPSQNSDSDSDLYLDFDWRSQTNNF